ncbi:unnamed protein product, partial [marine sediment metagenome]
ESDWDLLVFANEQILESLKIDKDFQLNNIDLLVVYNGNDFQDPWKNKRGSLKEFRWEKLSNRKARYIEKKWVKDEENTEKFFAKNGLEFYDIYNNKKSAVKIWPNKIDKSYSVIFRGEIAEGQDIEKVKKNLAELFKVKSEKIERLFSDKPAIIKKNVDHTTAMKYKSTLEKVGALCSIVPSPGETDVKPFEEAESEKKPSQPPDIKESESATAPALSIPSSLNVISPERTSQDLCFSPMQCPSISRAGTLNDVAPYQAIYNANGEIASVQTTGSSGDITGLIGERVKIKININGEDLFESSQNLFEIAIKVRDDLLANDSAALNEDLNNVNNASENIYNTQSLSGSRLNRIYAAETRAENDILNFTEYLSDTEDIDASEAIMNYQMELLTLQASLQAGARLLYPKLV